MTDRLATLMNVEVDTLDVPAPPAAEILGEGRRLRRRRTWTRGTAAALILAGVTSGAVALRGGGSEAAPATDTTPQVSWAVGDTVFLGADNPTQVTMPEFAQTLYYTSAGVLVRTNKDGSSDGGAPFHFELVRADGTTTKLAVTLGDVAPSVDPAQPYLAWATQTGGQIKVVVHDVSTDQDVATVEVPGTFDWGGWEAPPVALSGDLVYVGTNHEAEVVNWRTGEATTSETVPGSTFPSVEGGRFLRQGIDSTQVVDAVTGKALLDLPTGQNFVDLSPGGRFAIVSAGYGAAAGTRTDIYNVDSGAKVQVPSSGWGWTYDDSAVFRVQGSTMTTCSTTTGHCQETAVPPVGRNAQVRYAGFAYES